METYTDWPWERSLAVARSDSPLQIERILFASFATSAASWGLREGSVVTCLDRKDGAVDLELQGGVRSRLAREYAWFILLVDGLAERGNSGPIASGSGPDGV